MRPKAFTLVELLIVIIIVSIIAAFGIPSYTKSMGRAKARDAINNLSIIHAANAIYKIRQGSNVSGDLASLNSSLQLNVISSGGTTYLCDTVTCQAVSKTAGDFTVTATLNQPLDATNPNCCGTKCPTPKSCS